MRNNRTLLASLLVLTPAILSQALLLLIKSIGFHIVNSEDFNFTSVKFAIEWLLSVCIVRLLQRWRATTKEVKDLLKLEVMDRSGRVFSNVLAVSNTRLTTQYSLTH